MPVTNQLHLKVRRSSWTLTACRAWLAAMPLLLAVPGASAQQAVPPMPVDVPVHLVGDTGIDGSQLRPYRVELSLGRAGKDGPLALGESIQARGFQVTELTMAEVDGRKIWRRTAETRRADNGEVLAVASIDMDFESLRPLRASVEQGGSTQRFEYDGDAHVIRQINDETPGAEIAHDLWMFEAGAHDVLIAALPLHEGFAMRIPVVMASAGAKYWAIPRVVGSEKIDVGDSTERDAWVVELDWWDMGAQLTTEYYPGGGANMTGGKYWVLKSPPEGLPGVVRVRTEVDESNDSVVQMQAAATQ